MKNTRFEVPGHVYIPPKVQLERLKMVLREVLTPLQRYTVIAYYYQQKSIPEIARERRVNKSTVSRTLRRAEEKMKRYLQY